MAYKTCYWDDQTKSQLERDTTPEETAEIDERRAAALIPVVPQAVTMRQARLALLGAGLLANVDAAIATLPSPPKEEVAIEWEYSQTVVRDRPFVAMLGAALGLDDAALDALFIAAGAM